MECGNRRRNTLLAILATGALAFPANQGCRAPGPTPPHSPTRFDRLIQLYPEIQSGRFLVLADFEDSKHAELFHLVDASREARLEVHPRKGRPESGRSGLVFTSGSPQDAVVINNSNVKDWYLKRDWRDYDLLLMVLKAPRHGLALSLGIASGSGQDRLATQADIPLRKGWNRLRIDLATIGERITLDDVQEIRLAILGATKPAEVIVDDILLTANRVDLSGDSSHRDAGLYVQQVGRRWRIGAAGPGADFEITLAHGQIIEWFNVAADPFRLRNLLGGQPLGPTPMIDRGAGMRPRFPSTNGGIDTQSQLLEMNRVRVVVNSTWRGHGGASASLTEAGVRPLQKCTYTIYRTGQIFVTLETEFGDDDLSSYSRGLAVPAPFWADETPDIYLFGSNAKPGASQPLAGDSPPPAYAVARVEKGDAAILFVPFDPAGEARFQESSAPESPDDQSVAPLIIASWPLHSTIAEKSASHLLLGNVADLTPEDALARAASYLAPTRPRLSAGRWVNDDLTPSETPGYWPGSGCYVIAPTQGQVSLTLDGRDRPYFSPAFRILDDQHRNAWVYVDHLLFEPVVRDKEGNLLFQLPGTIRGNTLVEVLLRAASQSRETESHPNP